MYGIVHYEDSTGIRRVLCPTEADYKAELDAGCRWVEDEPRQFRNLWASIGGCLTYESLGASADGKTDADESAAGVR